MGRRVGIFAGVCVIGTGVIVQATCVFTHNVTQFMIGRFCMGFGASLAGNGAPIYILEICHPQYRGITVALYNSFWYQKTSQTLTVKANMF